MTTFSHYPKDRRTEADPADALAARMVAHELGNCLATLEGYAELLCDGAFGHLTPRQAGVLKRLQAVSRLIGILVDDLLVAPDAGVKIEPTQASFRSLAELTLDWLGPLAEAAGVEVREALAADLPLVFGDPPRIVQVLLNLLRNAVRHSPEGGAVILRASPTGSDLLIEVEDEGAGIADNLVSMLFDGPVESRPGLRNETPGSGLGLYISRAIVDAHGGRIGYRRGAAGGSLVWFTLPTLIKSRSQESRADAGSGCT